MTKALNDTEWIILRALWNKPPQSFKEIVNEIRTTRPDISWSYKTYHTYLRNMCTKGLVVWEEKNMKDKLYAPGLTEQQALDAETDQVISRSGYYGSLGRMMLAMAQKDTLTDSDRQDILEFARKLEKETEQK